MRSSKKTPVLSLLMVLALALVACGNSGGQAEANEAQGDAVMTEASAAVHPETIGFGEPVELASHAVPGEITVFDFTSQYCPPCRQLAPWLDRLHKEREGVKVVKVDINRPDVRGIDWRSPTARQFGLKSIPHFKVYDAEGKLMAEGQPAQVMVYGWLQELPAPAEQG